MAAIDLSGTWRTTAPRADVWAVVVDLSTWPRWWPAIDEVEVLAGTASAPEAARFTFGTPGAAAAGRDGGRPPSTDRGTARCRDRRRARARARAGSNSSTRPTGTAVRFAMRLDVRSLLFKPVERMLAGAARGRGAERLRQAGDDLARLAGGEPGEHEV